MLSGGLRSHIFSKYSVLLKRCPGCLNFKRVRNCKAYVIAVNGARKAVTVTVKKSDKRIIHCDPSAMRFCGSLFADKQL